MLFLRFSEDSDTPSSLEGIICELKSHKDFISKTAKEQGILREWIWRLKSKQKENNFDDQVKNFNLKTKILCFFCFRMRN